MSRTSLPPVTPDLSGPLLECWDAINASSARLAAALGSGDAEHFATLAAERHRVITDFFEQFPATPDNAALRAELLGRLIEANSRMLEESTGQLREATRLVVASRQVRAAIRAYEESDGSGSAA